jgi:hypothetical protein
MLMGGIHGKNLSSQLIVGPKVGKRSGGSLTSYYVHKYAERVREIHTYYIYIFNVPGQKNESSTDFHGTWRV